MVTVAQCKDKMAEVAASLQMQRIELELGNDSGRLYKRSFDGCWLVQESEPDQEEYPVGYEGAQWSVAITKGNRLVVYISYPNSRGGSYHLYDNFLNLSCDAGTVPEEVVAEVADALGIDYTIDVDI